MDESQKRTLSQLLAREHLAVVVTQGDQWPTATMQAFAETSELDLIFIMIESSEKFQNLRKRPNVTVLIDSRHSGEPNKFEILRASIQGVASEVPRESAEWKSLEPMFLEKNPFEAPFFKYPILRMVRVKPARVSYGGATPQDAFKAEF